MTEKKENRKNNKIRSIEKHGWYWIDREILTQYGRKIKPSGIAVYNVLASFANQETQTCFPTQQTIADLIGLSRATVNRKIRLLKELGLINIIRVNQHSLYFLLGTREQNYLGRCIKGIIRDVPKDNMNDNNRTKINNNVDKENFFVNANSFKGFEPKTREELLAWDIAKTLNDTKSLPLYLKYAKTLPETLLRELLSWIKQVPDKYIKKSRAALFNAVAKKYAEKVSSNNRH
jgi:DNA-binding MarR family transcriptional regulator